MPKLLPESPEGSELPVSETGAGVATLVVAALSAGADSGAALAVSALAGLVVPPLPCAGAEPLSCPFVLVGALSDRPSVSVPSVPGTLLTLSVPDDSLCAVPSFGAVSCPPAREEPLSEGAEAISPLSCVDAGAVAGIGAVGTDAS